MVKIDFKQGYVFLDDIQTYLCPTNYFLILINHLIDNFDDDNIIKILEKSVFKDCLVQSLKLKKLPLNKKILFFLNYLNSLGIGKTILKSIQKDKITFYQSYLYLSQTYQKVVKIKPKIPVEILQIIYIKVFLELVLGKKVKYLYNFDLNLNKLHLEFQIKNERIKSVNSDISYPKVQKGNVEMYIRKILINKNVSLNNGILKVWKTNASLMPYFFTIEFFKQISLRKKLNLKQIALMQGKASADMHKNLFGSDDKKIFENIIKLSDISGLGKNIVIDNNPLKFKFETNLISDYLKYFSIKEIQFFLNHMLYIYQGVFEFSFNKTVKTTINKNKIFLEIIQDKRKLNKNEIKFSEQLKTKNLVSIF